MINLAKIALGTKEVEVEYPGFPTFKVKVAYISPETQRRIYKESHVTKLDETYGVTTEVLDSDKFAEAHCREAIKGWSGLTKEVLQELILIDGNSLKDGEEIDYSEENALFIYRNCKNFERWVTTMVGRLKTFRN